jgi:cystathionine beta-lyase/cystathionine gamma-synthase
MLACELVGGSEAAKRFTRALHVAVHSASLGGTETLVTLPALTSHAGLSASERSASGISEGLLRISVGIEHSDDLLADFEQALQSSMPEAT